MGGCVVGVRCACGSIADACSADVLVEAGSRPVVLRKANPCQLDDIVTVSFDIESREFNGRWYTSIRAWKIQQGVVTTEAAAPVVDAGVAPVAAAPQANVQAFDPAAGVDDGTDLPF